MKKTKIVLGVLALTVLVGSGLVLSNGDFLQGAFPSSFTKLPDLVPAPNSTAITLSGEVGVDSTGQVIDMNLTQNDTCGILNQGKATASGRQYSRCAFSYGSYGSMGTPRDSNTLSLAVNGIETFSQSYTLAETSYDPYMDFLQEIHDTGSAAVTVLYSIDYASTANIAESDETNNTLTQNTRAYGTGITWVTR
jgi:hypothetical protein